MILIFIRRLLEMLGWAALQVLVCNHVHLMGYATPMLYVLFLVHLPINANRTGTLLWAFVLGLIIDIFSNTPGEAAGAMTLAALVQWPLLKVMAPKDCLEDMVPSYRTMGRVNHIRYIVVLAVVQHVVFFALEAFSYHHITDTLITLGASLALSLALMLTLETMRHGR